MRKRILVIGAGVLVVVLLTVSARLVERAFSRQVLPPTSLPPTVQTLPGPSGGEGLIAFVSVRDGNPDIYVMRADGSEAQNLTRDRAYDFSPRWSPDGRQLAFISTRTGKPEIFVMEATGAQLRQLTNDPDAAWGEIGGNPVSFDWSPASTPQLAYMISPAFNPPREIWVSSADGSEPERLLQLDSWRSGYLATLQWSPDGTRLALVARTMMNYQLTWHQLFVVWSDGSGLLRVSDTMADRAAPVWSRDGQALAFEIHQGGVSNIYSLDVSDAFHSGAPLPMHQLTSSGKDFNPQWQP